MSLQKRTVKAQGARTTIAALFILLGTTSAAFAAGPEPILLWPNGAPEAVGADDADRPTLRIYLPPADRATGAGVVICPGGGYGALAMDHEGHQVARWFNSIGVAGFVLKYRLAPRYRHPAPLQDVQRAIRYVRANAHSLGVVPHRIGVMGFSAGGHLASTAATRFDDGAPENSDVIERASCRPDFAILCYPVISMTEPFGHTGSRRNLLGQSPEPELAESLSSERQVTAATPPTFLFHTAEDAGVPVENSLAFYQALRRARVPAELHVYQDGPHGVGLAPGDPALFGWKDRLADWLKASGFLADVQRAAVEGTVTIDGRPISWGTITFVPSESSNQPIAWSIVRRGRYSIPSVRGAVVGASRVEIRSLGSVEPQPTIEDIRLYTRSHPDAAEPLSVNIEAGKNEFSFDIKE
jgi:acetyl esterase/lipase